MKSYKKTARVGYFTYTVYFQQLDGDDHGSTSIDKRAIFIDNSYPKESQRETLFHELLHAGFDDCPSFKLDYNSPDEREEDIVRFISPRMMQVLADNRWIREFLFDD